MVARTTTDRLFEAAYDELCRIARRLRGPASIPDPSIRGSSVRVTEGFTFRLSEWQHPLKRKGKGCETGSFLSILVA